jgi:hypothetical protein
MRPELERLIRTDWSAAGGGYDDHCRSIVAQRLTPSERNELCALLRKTDNEDVAANIVGVMALEHFPEYHQALLEAVRRPEPVVANRAANAFVGLFFDKGGYPDYLQEMFSNEALQRALGDEFGWLLVGKGSRLTAEMKAQFLGMFCRRFGKKTPSKWDEVSWWYRAFAEVDHTDDEVARILLRIWGELPSSDHQARYLLLRAMAAAPHPSYEPILRKGARSRIADLREEAEAGLAKLKG